MSVPDLHGSTIRVAASLLGRSLVRRLPEGTLLVGRIVDVEPYVGAHDKACHGARGRTASNQC